jgi:hypothetical protein
MCWLPVEVVDRFAAVRAALATENLPAGLGADQVHIASAHARAAIEPMLHPSSHHRS